MSWRLGDEAATELLGAALARTCPWNPEHPRSLYLNGELGAGKTTLARGLLRALGVAGAVKSPSYALLEPYKIARGTVIHVDLYRVRDAAETQALGVRDEFRGDTLVIVEWPEHGGAALPTPDLELTLQIVADYREVRVANATGAGADWFAATMNELIRNK